MFCFLHYNLFNEDANIYKQQGFKKMDWNTDNKNLKIICKIKNRIIGEKITKPFSHIFYGI